MKTVQRRPLRLTPGNKKTVLVLPPPPGKPGLRRGVRYVRAWQKISPHLQRQMVRLGMAQVTERGFELNEYGHRHINELLRQELGRVRQRRPRPKATASRR